MSRRRNKDKRNRNQRRGNLTIDRGRRSGHYQGHMYSEVYRDGKVYVYTAWNDNDDEVGAAMPFEDWVKSRRR